MATLGVSLRIPSTFSWNVDKGPLYSQIENATNPSVFRNVIFVGEAHAANIDLQRRNDVVFHFHTHEKIILVTERAMTNSDQKDIAQFFKKGVHEPLSSLGPGDIERDRRLVATLVEEMLQDKPGAHRAVLIAFGGTHEPKIRAQLLEQLKEGTINWYYYPSILEQIQALPRPVYANQVGYDLLGFTDPPLSTEVDPVKYLLTRGVWTRDFPLEILAGHLSPDGLKANGTIYAVYGRTTFAGTAIASQVLANALKKYNFRVGDATAIRLVAVTDPLEYTRLKNSL